MICQLKDAVPGFHWALELLRSLVRVPRSVSSDTCENISIPGFEEKRKFPDLRSMHDCPDEHHVLVIMSPAPIREQEHKVVIFQKTLQSTSAHPCVLLQIAHMKNIVAVDELQPDTPHKCAMNDSARMNEEGVPFVRIAANGDLLSINDNDAHPEEKKVTIHLQLQSA